jgi:superfamily II DNA or RNA helicase
MEPSSAVPPMPLHKDLRPKQAEVIGLFETKSRGVAKLPTGYGKTIAAAGSYAMLRHRGSCNRMLYIVPRRSQAKQAADSLPGDLATYFGINTKSIIVSEHQTQAHLLHRNGTGEVFIATIQALTTGDSFKTITEMMQTGRWLIVADEHHHYSQVRVGKGKDAPREDGIWADRLFGLNASAFLAMSATSKRFDGMDRFGEPDVTETYINAAGLGYVKKLSLHAYEFHVEAVTVDGVAYTYSTDEFLAAVGSDNPADVDAFMASRQMHWSPKYITPLITFPLDRMITYRLRGIKSQMLVQAMSVAHAKFVCDQISLLIPKSMSVDWVGTGPDGRSDSENDAVLTRFCPPKDRATGRRKWTLDILVNVGMAGEGLDCTDVTEESFLSSANLNITTLQIFGRGSRVMCVPDGVERPVCHINVDSSAPVAAYIGPKVMELFDDEIVVRTPGEPREERNGEYQLSPPEMNVMVVDVRLKDIRSEPMFRAVLEGQRSDPELAEVSDERLALKVEAGIEAYLNRGSSESSIIEQKKEKIDLLVSKVVGLIVTRMRVSGCAIDASCVGQLKKRINGEKRRRFGSVEHATSETLDVHYQWLREELEIPISKGHNLQGVPRWLR